MVFRRDSQRKIIEDPRTLNPEPESPDVSPAQVSNPTFTMSGGTLAMVSRMARERSSTLLT